MTFAEIIKNNCEHNCSNNWWPKFAFHYTDVLNAVNILDSGYLYSRVKAGEMNLMKTDNASQQVIDMTEAQTKANVRFYFRPLTPTQYHNEGFKHPSIRYDNDPNANVPVPVFFLFGLEKMLQLNELKFSERTQSGYGAPLCTGLEDFNKLDFRRIYSNGSIGEDHELIKYRHAELLYPNSFGIEDYLQVILCRNDIEKVSMLNLIKEQNISAYYKYKDKVKVSKDEIFKNNGLFVTNCDFYEDTVTFSFSNTHNKILYTNHYMKEQLRPVKAQALFEWTNKARLIYSTTSNFEIDYQSQTSIKFTKIPRYKDAKTLKIKIFFEGKTMCLIEQPLAESEVI